MSLTLLLFILMLFQQSICAPPADSGCLYIDSNTRTDENYLSQSNDAEKANMQKCFDLSFNNINTGECCYNKDSGDNKQYCVIQGTSVTGSLKCPSDYESKIANNCGMARFYQPQTSATCTDISLVDAYCCYVETTNHDTACIRQDEIDENDKNKIYEEMRNAVKRLKISTDTTIPEVKSVVCEGNYMQFYAFSLLLLAVML